MKKSKKWLKICEYIMIILTVTIITINNTYASNKEDFILSPKNIKAYRQSDTSVRIKWKTVRDDDGYIVYRYNRSNKKYAKVHTVSSSKAKEWIFYIPIF